MGIDDGVPRTFNRPHARSPHLRFALGLLLPVGVLYNVTQQPQVSGIGALIVWAVIAVLEAAVPSLSRSPQPRGPKPALSWLLRAFVPLQLLILAAGLAVAP